MATRLTRQQRMQDIHTWIKSLARNIEAAASRLQKLDSIPTTTITNIVRDMHLLEQSFHRYEEQREWGHDGD